MTQAAYFWGASLFLAVQLHLRWPAAPGLQAPHPARTRASWQAHVQASPAQEVQSGCKQNPDKPSRTLQLLLSDKASRCAAWPVQVLAGEPHLFPQAERGSQRLQGKEPLQECQDLLQRLLC